VGGQSHSYTRAEFEERYAQYFDALAAAVA
jgi:hypothetical protein